MFKKILVAFLAAQLVITPVQAKQECTKAFVGVDDLVIISLGLWLFFSSLKAIGNSYERDELKKQLEQEKAKQPAPNSCLL
jgi:hypothetical protein